MPRTSEDEIDVTENERRSHPPRAWILRDGAGVSPGYVRPATVADARRAHLEPGAEFLAGGTDLLVQPGGRGHSARVLVSLGRLPELRELGVRGDRLRIGSMVTMARLAADPDVRRLFPALVEACESVGSPSIRSAATIGGNICHAAPSADVSVALLACGAEATILEDAEERAPLDGFFRGPGRTVLGPGRLLTGFWLPIGSERTGSAFQKFGRRRAMEIAIVNAAAVVSLAEGGAVQGLTLALGAVAPTPVLVPGLDALVRGRTLDHALLSRVATAAMEASRPISDIRASAAYRRRMVATVATETVKTAWERAVARALADRGDDGA